MEIPEIIKRIDDIKINIDTAFNEGRIDFDKISAELASIKAAISERDLNPGVNRNGGHQSRLQITSNQSTIRSEDYR